MNDILSLNTQLANLKLDYDKKEKELLALSKKINELTSKLDISNKNHNIFELNEVFFKFKKIINTNPQIDELTSCIKEYLDCFQKIDKIEINQEEKVFVNPLFFNEDVLILKNNLDFSKYSLNKGKGRSLKDFFLNYPEEIKAVLEYYSGDPINTIKYLQKKHGLCQGQEINLSTFKINMNTHLGVKNKKIIKLFINEKLVDGDSNVDVFLKAIISFGVDKLLVYCKDLFDNMFYITEQEPLVPYGRIEKILDKDKEYFIFIHSDTNYKVNKLKEIYKKLKDKQMATFSFSITY